MNKIIKSWKNVEPEVKRDYKVVAGFLAATMAISTGTLIAKDYKDKKEASLPKTAVIVDDNSALLVDFNKYECKQIIGKNYPVNEWTFYTLSGDTFSYVDNGFNGIYVLKGDNSHDEAEDLARNIVGEEGIISSYNNQLTKTLKNRVSNK